MLDVLKALNFADKEPQLSHRFGVFFLIAGIIPNPIDIRFQKVSGLSTEVQLETINEGGDNVHMLRVPKSVNYGNLVLERGYVASFIPSPLTLEFKAAFNTLKFLPSNVLVTLFNDNGIPIGGWVFKKAYPVKWSVSNLDAQSDSVIIDTMELAYSKVEIMRM